MLQTKSAPGMLRESYYVKMQNKIDFVYDTFTFFRFAHTGCLGSNRSADELRTMPDSGSKSIRLHDSKITQGSTTWRLLVDGTESTELL